MTSTVRLQDLTLRMAMPAPQAVEHAPHVPTPHEAEVAGHCACNKQAADLDSSSVRDVYNFANLLNRHTSNTLHGR